MRTSHVIKTALVFFFGCISLQLYSQSNFLWKAGGNANDEALANTIDTNGNIYTTGYFSAIARFDTFQVSSMGGGDVFVVKQDTSGAIKWVRRGGGNGSDRAYAIETDLAGNIYICGSFSGTATFGSTQLVSVNNTQDIFVAKLDPSGTFLWAKRFGGPNIDLAFGLTVDRSSNVVITGQFRDTVAFGPVTLYSTISPADTLPSYDIYILKLDPAGNFLWVKQGLAKYDDRGLALASDDSSNIYITGQFSDTLQFTNTYNNNGYNIGFTMKMDPAGNEIWFKKLFASYVTAYSIAVKNGSVCITGNFLGSLTVEGTPNITLTGGNPNKIFIAKYNTSGNLLWATRETSGEDVSSLDVAIDANSDVYIAGTFKCRFTDYSALYGNAIFYSVGKKDVFVAKYTSTGQRAWQRHFGGPRNDWCSAISVFNANNPVIAGSYERIFNVPRGNNFFFNTSDTNVTGSGPTQPSNYCSTSNYNQYISVTANAFKNIFLARPVDLLRAPYDYYNRTSGPCLLDTVSPCINACQISLTVCDHVYLFANTKTGADGMIGPEYHYLWSTGDTTPSIYVDTTGWYSLTIERNDSCMNSITNLIYVQVYDNPNPVIYDVGCNMGMTVAPTSPCPSHLVVVQPNVQWLVGGNIPPSYLFYWTTPSGTFYNDSVQVTSSGTYTFTITAPIASCITSRCVDVCVLPAGSNGCPTNFNPEIHFTNPLLDQGDTITLCGPGNFPVCLVDSALFAQGQPTSTCVFALWQSSFPSTMNYDTTFGDHCNSIHVPATGSYTITVTVYHPLTCLPIYTVTRTFYVIINPNPVLNVQITGPTFICPGDTVVLVLSGAPHYTISGSAIIYISSDSDSVWVNGPGPVSVTGYITDTITGCSGSDSDIHNVLMTPASNVTIIPEDAIICPFDSVLLIAEPGTNYVWYGPLGTPIATTQSIYVGVPGYYHYTYTDLGGCNLVSIFVELREYSTPALSMLPSNLMCPGDSVQLVISTTDTTGIQWLPPLSGNSLTQTVYGPGVYSAQVTSCNITTTITGTVFLSPVNASILTNGPAVLCAGDSVTLTGYPGMATYTWQPGNIYTTSITVYNIGTYYLQVTDFNGCIANDSVVVTPNPAFPPPVVQDTTICRGDSLLLSASASGTVLWYSSPTSTPPLASGATYQTPFLDSTTTYYVSNSDAICESVRVPITVFINPVSYTPVILGDTILCYGDSLALSVNPITGATYSWWGPNNFQSSDSSFVIHPATSINAGYYYLQLSDNMCISGIDSAYVTVYPAPDISVLVTGNIPHCPGTDVILASSDTSLNSYTWLPTGDTTWSITVSDTGTFTLAVSNQNGCTDTSSSVTVTLFPPPPAPQVSDTCICYGDSIMLTAFPGGPVIWLADNGDTSFVGNPFYTPPLYVSTFYVLFIVDSNGCRSPYDTVNICVSAPPPSLIGDTSYCEGDTVFISLANPNGFTGWTGPNGFQSPNNSFVINNADTSNSGYYTATFIGNSCVSSLTVHIGVNPIPTASIIANSPVCEGNSLAFTSTSVDGGNYQWTGPDNFSSSLQSNFLNNADTLMSGWYHLAVSAFGCSGNSDSVYLKVVPFPVFDLMGDTAFCKGKEITLFAPAGYDTYLWSTGSISNSIKVSESGTYTLTVTNFPDCSRMDNVNVEVTLCDPVENNVFTPNNDSYNDEFYLDLRGATPLNMQIFNRWGELVRDLNGSNVMKWDGKNNYGKEVVPGVYYYICHFINNTSENQTLTGFVHLIR